MYTTSEIVSVAVFFFLAGCVVASLIRDKRWDQINKSQQDRGDYWFSRYQELARTDWWKGNSKDE